MKELKRKFVLYDTPPAEPPAGDPPKNDPPADPPKNDPPAGNPPADSFKAFKSEADYKAEMKKVQSAATQEMLKALGIEKIDDLKNIVTQHNENIKAQMSDLEKANANVDELTKANTGLVSLLNQTTARSVALELGVDSKQVDYLVKLIDFNEVVGDNGYADNEKIKQAISKVLEDVPAFKGTGVPAVPAAGRPPAGSDTPPAGGKPLLTMDVIKSMSPKEAAARISEIREFMNQKR